MKTLNTALLLVLFSSTIVFAQTKEELIDEYIEIAQVKSQFEEGVDKLLLVAQEIIQIPRERIWRCDDPSKKILHMGELEAVLRIHT
ncbi:hypothetical protein P4E94_19780 [Pontiellaceae bacterium B12219]|nr:hypothetical protein [Pontiellaceae bacterium B12219]